MTDRSKRVRFMSTTSSPPLPHISGRRAGSVAISEFGLLRSGPHSKPTTTPPPSLPSISGRRAGSLATNEFGLPRRYPRTEPRLLRDSRRADLVLLRNSQRPDSEPRNSPRSESISSTPTKQVTRETVNTAYEHWIATKLQLEDAKAAEEETVTARKAAETASLNAEEELETQRAIYERARRSPTRYEWEFL